MTARRHRAGFTLLEVMVATALLGMAAVGLLALINQSLRNATIVAEYDRAAMWARTTMDELLAVEPLPLGRELTGALGPEAGWRAVAEPYEFGRGGAGQSLLARIDLEVYWRSRGQRESIRVEAFRRIRVRPDMNLQDFREPSPNALF